MIRRSLLLLFTIVFPFSAICFQPPRTTTNTRMTAPQTIFPLSLKDDDGAEPRPKVGILRVVGPDRKGIVAAFAQVLYGQ
jgi:hypothetical protein